MNVRQDKILAVSLLVCKLELAYQLLTAVYSNIYSWIWEDDSVSRLPHKRENLSSYPQHPHKSLRQQTLVTWVLEKSSRRWVLGLAGQPGQLEQMQVHRDPISKVK